MKREKYKRKKRSEAEERTAARAARTDEEQLRRLDAGAYKATKERTKLQGNINRRKRIEKGTK